MQNDIPRNGALSGMFITAATAAITFPLVYFHDAARSRFSAPMGEEIASLFLASAFVMSAHKLESYVAREYDHCPVYITQTRAWGDNPARAIFLSFVTTFLGMLLIVALALFGPPWHMAIVTVWLGQGLHEIHHAAKSLARRMIYPGLFTSLVFVAVQSGMLFPRWHDLVIGERGVFYAGYYLALPLVLLAFYVEDRRWTARTPRRLWDPDARVREPRFVLDVRTKIRS